MNSDPEITYAGDVEAGGLLVAVDGFEVGSIEKLGSERRLLLANHEPEGTLTANEFVFFTTDNHTIMSMTRFFGPTLEELQEAIKENALDIYERVQKFYDSMA